MTRLVLSASLVLISAVLLSMAVLVLSIAPVLLVDHLLLCIPGAVGMLVGVISLHEPRS